MDIRLSPLSVRLTTFILISLALTVFSCRMKKPSRISGRCIEDIVVSPADTSPIIPLVVKFRVGKIKFNHRKYHINKDTQFLLKHESGIVSLDNVFGFKFSHSQHNEEGKAYHDVTWEIYVRSEKCWKLIDYSASEESIQFYGSDNDTKHLVWPSIVQYWSRDVNYKIEYMLTVDE
jgi:hypothetical protein